MKKISLFLMFVLGFGMMGVQTAKAAEAITKAPCEGTPGDETLAKRMDGSNCQTGGGWNARQAIAPYAQVVADDSYTFIGISHPSLATAHTTIGVVVEALGMTTVPDNAAGRAAVFTISAGTTHRVFIINQGHATINANNSAFTDSQTHLITTTDGGQYGSVKVWSVGTSPNYMTNTTKRPGIYHLNADNTVWRHDNLNQLSMWGVVYQTSNGAGFAMEFIGDMADSSVAGSGLAAPAVSVTGGGAIGHEVLDRNMSGFGRGIN